LNAPSNTQGLGGKLIKKKLGSLKSRGTVTLKTHRQNDWCAGGGGEEQEARAGGSGGGGGEAGLQYAGQPGPDTGTHPHTSGH
jgi:hypothetical protein